MKMPSVMGGHRFSEVPKAEIQRSQFDRSFGYKTTFDAGYLIPFYVDEALPGDTFTMNVSAFARLATPLKPIMDNMVMETFFFFVPYRLVWDNWERFQGAQDDPGDSTDFTIPQKSNPGGFAVGTIYDYMGIPPGIASTSFSALPLRAYNVIWNEWFRDQNLQDSVTVAKGDAADGAIYNLLRRGKRHDYFTSCLPWPQKGDPVALPLTGNALVNFESGPGQEVTVRKAGTTNDYNLVAIALAPGVVTTPGGTSADTTHQLFADLSSVTAATINELRQAFQVQRILERDARGGTRYIEAVKARFGVTSPDARLQRPEYLGGGSSPVLISPIAQTSEEGTTPQGNLAAMGTVSFSGHGFAKSFTEHGVVLGLVSVRADLTYQQGLERQWSRATRFDFFEPALAHLGEQAVLNSEIYLQGTAADGDVFGYQERFAEYRYKPSMITGLFRSQVAGTLDVWHLSQEFSALPALDDVFIVEDPPIDRVIATPTEPHFLFDSYSRLKCARPMPLYGVPGLIDHF